MSGGTHSDPVDPDVDVRDPSQRADAGRRELVVLGVIALGGVGGAEARYAISVGVPHDAGSWPWSTLIVNVVGSLLIGVLMVVVLERYHPHHLLRPFLGVGVLGGFTTFSTLSLDLIDLLQVHRPVVAISYALASVTACLAAVVAGLALTRAALPTAAR